ncbi:MAG: hypothetical protein NTX47_04740 [Candidatus Omnitrophica bacterium]|nr:hypothetical protein [Candidatus Omnitrophota bacterium]
MERLGRFLGAFLFIMLFMGIYSMAEDITLTTYYPAPYGAYDELTTTGDTYLATTSGNVGIGATSASNKLDVTGTVNATAYSVNGTAGFTGTFLDLNGKIVTVKNGIIISVI